MTSCYILADNKKAYDHFKKAGYKLTKGKHLRYLDYLLEDSIDHGDDLPDFDKYLVDVYYVDGFASGTKFHRYLVDKDLLKK